MVSPFSVGSYTAWIQCLVPQLTIHPLDFGYHIQTSVCLSIYKMGIRSFNLIGLLWGANKNEYKYITRCLVHYQPSIKVCCYLGIIIFGCYQSSIKAMESQVSRVAVEKVSHVNNGDNISVQPRGGLNLITQFIFYFSTKTIYLGSICSIVC